MTGKDSTESTTSQPAVEDFAGQYKARLEQFSQAFGKSFIGFEELKAAVKQTLEADGVEEGCNEMLEFDDFVTFFEWFDALSVFEQRDADDYAQSYKSLLEVVYLALVAEYKVQVQGQACLKDTPEATMQLVERLKAMHPDHLWGTTPLADYDQYADTGAPAVIIFFALDFHMNRLEIPDPYSDIYGSAVAPSTWGLSDEAAKLLREHNTINVSRNPN